MGSLYVTGASGALGGSLLRHFGAAATGVSRHPRPEGWRHGWLRAEGEDASWVGDPEAVILHAGGVSSATATDSAEALAAPHLAFADALVARGWRGRMVFLSSAAVYGEADRLPIAETAPVRPLNAYGAHKALVEAALAERAAKAGFGLTVLRLANVYGTARDLANRRVAALVLEALSRGTAFATYGDGSSRRDYLHVDDFCRAVARAVAAPAGTVVNLGSGQGTTLTELIAEAERLTGRRLTLQREAARPEAASSVLDIAAAGRELNWRPVVTLEEGLRRLQAAMEG